MLLDDICRKNTCGNRIGTGLNFTGHGPDFSVPFKCLVEHLNELVRQMGSFADTRKNTNAHHPDFTGKKLMTLPFPHIIWGNRRSFLIKNLLKSKMLKVITPATALKI
ncbi:MAG: hypothetical protein ACR2KZ_08520 [Segetibacter sp.]